MTDSALRELADDPSSRKRFFKMLGGAGAVSAATVFLAACGGDDEKDEPATAGEVTNENTSDLEVLNYALTLEFLEAEFYDKVIARGLVKAPMVADLAKQFGEPEQEHAAAVPPAREEKRPWWRRWSAS